MASPDSAPSRPRPTLLRRLSDPGGLSPLARTTGRLALVAGCVLATVGILVGVTLHVRRSDEALAETTTRTLHDYTGYASRLMASEILRRFAEQRLRVLAPVTGSAGRAVAPPSLDDIVARGDREPAARGPDPSRGYFRLAVAGGAVEGRGVVHDDFARRIADTLRAIARMPGRVPDPGVIILHESGRPVSVAFATLSDTRGRLTAVYGFTYSRAPRIAYFAREVFHDTPLLPPSFAGQRWNYDTTRVQPGEVVNDALLSVRVLDREGNLFWGSPGAPSPTTAIREHAVIRTAAGGMVVETTLLAGSEPALVPAALRSVQRWWIGAVIALALMLAVVSLLALSSERLMARGRRAEAMEQLALGLRHELNNALSTVLLNAELLGEEVGDDQAMRDQVNAIAEQAERMRNVLRRLERRERLDVIVPYLDEGYMVDLSAREVEPVNPAAPRAR